MLSRRLLRIKVIKALYAHLKSGSDNMIASEKSLLNSVDRAYDLYIQMLMLPIELAHYAQTRQELAKRKKLPTAEDLNPNTKFTDNSIISKIAASQAISDYAGANTLSWSRHPELIRSIYNQMVESDYYTEYMISGENTFNEDKKLLESLFMQLQECEALDTMLEESSILWCDDMPFILMMIMRTLSNLRPSQSEVKVLPKFKSEDDLDFVRSLFQRTLVNFSSYEEYIERFTSNWDLDRIVFMDNLIIGTAMAELVTFSSIPIKVTLDEYIEISKYYSTPGSSTFINGVLDKIVGSLSKEGQIQKSGTGLL